MPPGAGEQKEAHMAKPYGEPARGFQHMVIARSLFRRLVADEKQWWNLFDDLNQFPAREDALAAIDEMPEVQLWIPPSGCDNYDETGHCQGHDR